MDKFLKIFRLVKVDEAKRMVYGVVTAEAVDHDNEICHYESTKVEYQKKNEQMSKMSDGENIMPLREMHQLNAIGAGKSIDFNDEQKEIRMGFKVVDDSAWKKVCEKVLLAFSQGGDYIKKWKEGDKNFYTAGPGEVSLVDNPCLPGAIIEYVKADGKVEMFKTPESKLTDADVERITKALEESLAKGDSTLSTTLKDFAEKIAKLTENRSDGGKMTKELLEKAAKSIHGHLSALHEHHKAFHDKMHKAHTDHMEHAQAVCEKCMKAMADGDEKETEKALVELDGLMKTINDAKGKEETYVLIGKTSDGIEVFRKSTSAVPKDLKLEKADGFGKAEVEQMITDALAKQKKEFDEQLNKDDAAAKAKLFLVERDSTVVKAQKDDEKRLSAVV